MERLGLSTRPIPFTGANISAVFVVVEHVFPYSGVMSSDRLAAAHHLLSGVVDAWCDAVIDAKARPLTGDDHRTAAQRNAEALAEVRVRP
jgi:hypothetical protein